MSFNRKDQLTPLPLLPALFVQTLDVYWTAWIRLWSQGRFLFWCWRKKEWVGAGMMNSNIQYSSISTFHFSCFSGLINLFIFWTWQLLGLLIDYNRSLNQHYLSKIGSFFRVIVLPGKKILNCLNRCISDRHFAAEPNLLCPSELKYTYEISTIVLVQPCPHTPILVSDCPLPCSFQLIAMFVHLLQNVFMRRSPRTIVTFKGASTVLTVYRECTAVEHPPSLLSSKCYCLVSQRPFKQISKLRTAPPTFKIQHPHSKDA